MVIISELALVRHCQTWQYRPQSIDNMKNETVLKKFRRHDTGSLKNGLKSIGCRHSALMKTGKGTAKSLHAGTYGFLQSFPLILRKKRFV